MKKDKEETLLKAARKKTRTTIQSRLSKLLKTITSETGQEDSINIEKEAKRLAKKITKHLKADKPADKTTPSSNGTAKPVAKDADEKPVNRPSVPDSKKAPIKAKPAVKATSSSKPVQQKAETTKTPVQKAAK